MGLQAESLKKQCPTCEADVGQLCISGNGKPQREPHNARYGLPPNRSNRLRPRTREMR